MSKEKFKVLKVSGRVTFCQFDEGNYRLTISGDDTSFKELALFEDEEDEMIIKTNDETGEQYINVKSSYRPYLYLQTESGKAVETEKINDNCEVTLKVKPYAWEYKRKKGVSLGLQAILITEYKESSYSNADFFNVEIDKSDALPF